VRQITLGYPLGPPLPLRRRARPPAAARVRRGAAGHPDDEVLIEPCSGEEPAPDAVAPTAPILGLRFVWRKHSSLPPSESDPRYLAH